MAKNVIAETESDILRYLGKRQYIDYLRDVEASLRRDFERTITGVKDSQAYREGFEEKLADYIQKVTKAHNYFVSNEGEREEQDSGRWAYGFPEGPEEPDQYRNFTRLRDAAYRAKVDLYDYQNQAGERTQTVGLARDLAADKRNDRIKDGAKRVGNVALILGGAALATAAALGIGNSIAGSTNGSRDDDRENKAKVVHQVKGRPDYTGGGQWGIPGEKKTIKEDVTHIREDETIVVEDAPAPVKTVIVEKPVVVEKPVFIERPSDQLPAAPQPGVQHAPVVAPQPVSYVVPEQIIERVPPAHPPIIIHGPGVGHHLPPPPPPPRVGHMRGGHSVPMHMRGGHRTINTTIVNNTINSNNQNCGNQVQVRQTHNMRQTVQSHVSHIKVQRTHEQPVIKVPQTQAQPTIRIKRTKSSPAPIRVKGTKCTPTNWTLPSGKTGRTIQNRAPSSRSAPRAGRCGGGSPMRRGGR